MSKFLESLADVSPGTPIHSDLGMRIFLRKKCKTVTCGHGLFQRFAGWQLINLNNTCHDVTMFERKCQQWAENKMTCLRILFPAIQPYRNIDRQKILLFFRNCKSGQFWSTLLKSTFLAFKVFKNITNNCNNCVDSRFPFDIGLQAIILWKN